MCFWNHNVLNYFFHLVLLSFDVNYICKFVSSSQYSTDHLACIVKRNKIYYTNLTFCYLSLSKYYVWWMFGAWSEKLNVNLDVGNKNRLTIVLIKSISIIVHTTLTSRGNFRNNGKYSRNEKGSIHYWIK